jgi:hypothetical protein
VIGQNLPGRPSSEAEMRGCRSGSSGRDAYRRGKLVERGEVVSGVVVMDAPADWRASGRLEELGSIRSDEVVREGASG